MLTYASMLRFFGQFFVKSELKLNVLRMRIYLLNGYLVFHNSIFFLCYYAIFFVDERLMQSDSASALQLPLPDEVSQEMSRRLTALVRAEIAAQGPMTFARYMELALYAPTLGYYRSGTQKFGEYGDFITAPEWSPLFSQCLARQCRQVLQDIPQGDILEFGAGSGVMARVILQNLAQMNALPEHYYILELSAELKQRQRLELERHAPALLSRVTWLTQLPQEKFRGIMLANEVIDAMPVHRFGYWQGLKEYYVVDRSGELGWALGPLSNAALKTQLAHLEAAFVDGYSSEINALLPGWIASLDAALEQGVILLIDYGMTRREYYHPDRGCGTILCHYRHRAHANPFWWPGLQDITAQVDFTAVAEAAIAGDLAVYGYTHQAAFLLNCGITDFMNNDVSARERLVLSRQIQRLTLPGDMGEAFKAMALTKNYETDLLGFRTLNQLERL
jgi:SAM-dependent MidA family methyltransferase/cbb3-type cytochrome oxidase subunit 3